MASSSNDLQQSGDGCEQIVNPVRDELTNIIRRCVREEMQNHQRTERPGIGNITSVKLPQDSPQDSFFLKLTIAT